MYLLFAVIRRTLLANFRLPPTKNKIVENPMRTIRFLFVLLAVVFSVSRAQGQQTISCSSDDGKKHYCNAETRAGCS